MRAAQRGGTATLCAWLALGCAGGPPRQPDDLCAIFAEKRSWHVAARRSYRRWGVPEPVQLAIVHQESRFRADARPPRRRYLGFIPGPRLSSAYGYGQVKRGTWEDYRRSTGNRGGDRDDFGDVADFIGWYGHRIHRDTGVAKSDAFSLYLAYHEGPSGYRRGTHRAKGWLLGVARQVERRSRLYAAQHRGCPEPRRRRFWPF